MVIQWAEHHLDGDPVPQLDAMDLLDRLPAARDTTIPVTTTPIVSLFWWLVVVTGDVSRYLGTTNCSLLLQVLGELSRNLGTCLLEMFCIVLLCRISCSALYTLASW